MNKEFGPTHNAEEATRDAAFLRLIARFDKDIAQFVFLRWCAILMCVLELAIFVKIFCRFRFSGNIDALSRRRA